MITNDSFALYRINPQYLQYLQQLDHRVPKHCAGNQELVGVVVTVNNRNYFAPLTTPKLKHANLRDSNPTIFKIMDNHQHLGSVLLNNMIPVTFSQISSISFDQLPDLNFRNLMLKDYQLLKSNRDLVTKKAQQLYSKVVNAINPSFAAISCDFRKLEIACDNYQ